MDDTGLEIIVESKVEKELHDNGLIYVEGANGTAFFEDIGLFEEDKWQTTKYYLLNIRYYGQLIDIFAHRNSIIRDLKGLGILTDELEKEFNRLINVVFRCYRVGI